AAFHRASTNRTSHQPFNRENTETKTVRGVALFRTKRFKHRDVQQMQQNNCVKRGERRQRVNGRSATEDCKINGDDSLLNDSLLKGQYTFSRTQCVQVTILTINKIEKIGINKIYKMVKFHEINANKIIHF